MKTLKYLIATIFIALVVYSNTAKADIKEDCKDVKLYENLLCDIYFTQLISETQNFKPIFHGNTLESRVNELESRVNELETR